MHKEEQCGFKSNVESAWTSCFLRQMHESNIANWNTLFLGI